MFNDRNATNEREQLAHSLTAPLLANAIAANNPVLNVGNDVAIDVNGDNAPIKRIKEKENALKLSIAMLSSQLSRHNQLVLARNLSIYSSVVVLLGVSAGSIYHFLRSKAIFDAALALHDATIQTVTSVFGDITQKLCPQVDFFDDAYGTRFAELTLHCEQLVSDEQNRGHLMCAEALQNMCDGPGMWMGYTPLIIGAGMVLPFLIAMGLLAAQPCSVNSTLKLKDLMTEKLATIKKNADIGGIAFPDNAKVEDVLEIFKEQLSLLTKDQCIKKMAEIVDKQIPNELTDIVASYMSDDSATIVPANRARLFALRDGSLGKDSYSQAPNPAPNAHSLSL
jgi:hypothetical protein